MCTGVVAVDAFPEGGSSGALEGSNPGLVSYQQQSPLDLHGPLAASELLLNVNCGLDNTCARLLPEGADSASLSDNDDEDDDFLHKLYKCASIVFRSKSSKRNAWRLFHSSAARVFS